MTTKTITVTENAYDALKRMKEPNESFSDTLLRISGKKSIREFAGALSEKSAIKLEKSMKEIRKERTKMRKARIKRISNMFRGE